MKFLLASSALAIAFAVAPAYAQQPQHNQPPLTQPPVVAESTAEGSVKVEGVAPSQVLGAIAPEKLTDKAQREAEATTTAKVEAQPPEASTQVTVDSKVEQRADATVETRTETITPVSGRAALDADNPIAPEVREVVDKKKRYTTADIVAAQLEARRNTPPLAPTTTITTTTTTPAPG